MPRIRLEVAVFCRTTTNEQIGLQLGPSDGDSVSLQVRVMCGRRCIDSTGCQPEGTAGTEEASGLCPFTCSCAIPIGLGL